MKKWVVVLFLVSLAGCASGSDFVSRVGEGIDSLLPGEEDCVPVIYPAEFAGSGRLQNGM